MLKHLCFDDLERVKDSIASKMEKEEAPTQLPNTLLMICLRKRPIEIHH